MKLHIISTGSKGNCYVLESKKEALIIEVGARVTEVKRALNFNVSKIKGALVTHEHSDHSKYMKDFLKEGIPIHALKKVHDKCSGHYKHNEKNLEYAFDEGYDTNYHEFMIGEFRIKPFDVKHDVPCVGFLIYHKECGKVLFLTDTYYCPFKFDGLSQIIIEANYSKEILDSRLKDSELEFLSNRVKQSHMSFETCKQLLDVTDLRKVNNIVLIHLSDGNSDERKFKEELEATGKCVTVASNGMEIDFNLTPI